MCGIFGFVTTEARGAEGISTSAALAATRHRGPDGEGIWTGVAGQVRAGFAHARLAIIDLSDNAYQPMRSRSGRHLIVFNGEVFNFDELRRELESLGRQFATRGDTEVVLQAFEEWGADCVPRLRGMFAFAVFDTQTGSLFAARDRLGVKPFYFARIPGGVAFASEVRTLLAAGAASRKLSMEAVSGYLTTGSVPEPLTIVAGIECLPAGCTLEWNEHRGLGSRRYWDVPVLSAEPGWSFEDASAALRAELRESVRIQLVSDVPLGVFLSGGIDSSALVALAAEVSHAPLHTFTVTLDDKNLDEAKWAADVAQRFGCEHHIMHLSAGRMAEAIGDYVGALDQPSYDGVNTYFVSKATKEAGVTVALSGLGGDELFAGYPLFRHIGRLNRLRKLTRPGFQVLPDVLSGVLPDTTIAHRLRKFAALSRARGHKEAYGILRGLLLPDQVQLLLRTRPDPGHFIYAPEGFEEHASSDGVDPVNAHGVLEICNYMRNTLLRDADVMSMANALEVRVPLVDHKVVEIATRVHGSVEVELRVQQAAAGFRGAHHSPKCIHAEEAGVCPSIRLLVSQRAERLDERAPAGAGAATAGDSRPCSSRHHVERLPRTVQQYQLVAGLGTGGPD